MPRCILLLILLFAFSQLSAQQKKTNKKSDPIAPIETITPVKDLPAPPPPSASKGVTYPYASEMPGFPGDVYAWLATNIHYPKDAKDQKIEGRIRLSFVINEEGYVTNVRVVEGVYPSLDSEAVRVVSMMPQWKPGYKNKQPIKVSYSLPIAFKL